MCSAESQRLGRALQTQFRGIRFPERDEAGTPEARPEGGVSGCHVPRLAQCPIAHVVWLSDLHRAQVLEQKRHAAERPCWEGWGSCRGLSLVKEWRNDGVENRVKLLDTSDRGVNQFAR